jgi:hypothetical protein
MVGYTPMAYKITTMEFIETATFTKMVTTLLTDEEYRGLQNDLVEDPERGDLIKGGGGIRKLRHAIQGRGKKWWCAGDLLLGQRQPPDLHASRLSEVKKGQPD